MITSIVDNDLYKFTMQQAVLAPYPDAEVIYEFINRRPSDRFNDTFFAGLLEAIGAMADLQLQRDEQTFLAQRRAEHRRQAGHGQPYARGITLRRRG